DGLAAQALDRSLDLTPRGRGVRAFAAPSGDVELGRPEDAILRADLIDDASRDFLRCAVARCGVEDGAAALEHGSEHRTEGFVVFFARGGAERRGAPEPDDRQFFSGRGNRTLDQLAL